MAEEHGYQRSGKKCKEKFENLYKYYKKTKDGKAGRHDGKHYRFFRQLEAIYGGNNNDNSSNHQCSALETSHNYPSRNSDLLYHTTSTSTPSQPFNQEVVHQAQKLSESQLSNYSNNSTEFETSSSENNEDDRSAIAAFKVDQTVMGFKQLKGTNGERQSCLRPVRKRWKTEVEGFVDSQMRKIVEAQENWMEKMLKSIVDKEEERVSKEEERRRQEVARFDQEVIKFWAKEKAWVEARDAALLEALKKFKGKGVENIRSDDKNDCHHRHWTEQEIESLIGIRTSLEQTFQARGYLKDELWEDIAGRLTSFGYQRSAAECEEKWESVNIQVKMDEGILCSSSNMGNQMQPHCYNLLYGEGENLWVDRYGVKLSKGEDQQISNK